MSRIAVLGIGKSGLSAAKWAVTHGLECVLSDVLPLKKWPEELVSWCELHGVSIDAGGHSSEKILSSQLIVPSPGIPLDTPILRAAKREKIPICGELALAVGLWPGPKIGITGTNGKTTCTNLVGEMLKRSGRPTFVGGNLGTPVLEKVHEVGEEETILVAEVSSFQLDLFPLGPDMKRTVEAVKRLVPEFRPPAFDVSILLNISQDHLERYKDFGEYVKSKARIFRTQSMGSWGIIGRDAINTLKEHGVSLRLRQIALETPDGGEKVVVLKWPEGGSETYDTSRFKPMGRHNRENLMAALYAARLLGARQSACQEVINGFSPPGHRLELVAEKSGIRFIDDSKATNLHATLAAIEAIGGTCVLICGGQAKGQDFSPLNTPQVRERVRGAVIMGEASRELSSHLGWTQQVAINGDGDGWEKMHQAVKAAFEMARSGDVVLLSPACASFDLFSGYGDRGDAFRAAVERL